MWNTLKHYFVLFLALGQANYTSMFISQHDVARFRTGQLSDTMTNVQPLWMIESWLPAANWPGHICGWTWAVECHQTSLSVKCAQYYIILCIYIYWRVLLESDMINYQHTMIQPVQQITVRCSLPCLVGQQISGSKCLCWTALEFWHWANDIAGWIHRCQTCGGSGSSSPGRDTITCPVRLDEEVWLEMDILWSSYDHPMIILWSSYDHPMIILWSSYDPFAS